MRWVLTLGLGLCVAGLSQAQEPVPVSSEARVEQSLLPDLGQRAERAEARVQAREQWWQGTGSFRDAFPRWAGGPMDDRTAIQGRLAQLQGLEVSRAAEGLKAPPEVGEALLGRWLEARDRALEAEATADESERTLLAGVLAVLEQRPHLAREASEPLRRIAPAPPKDADSELVEAHATVAAQTDEVVRLLDRTLSSVIRARVLGQDPSQQLPPFQGMESWRDAGFWALMWSELGEQEQRAILEALGAAEQQGTLTGAPPALYRPNTSDWPVWGAAAEVPSVVPGAAVRDDRLAQAEEAERQAEQQLASARDSRERRRAEVKAGLAQARRFDAEVGVIVEEREQETVALQRRVDEVMEQASLALQAIEGRALGERPDVDAPFTALRGLNTELRSHPAILGAHLIDAEQRATAIRTRVSRERAAMVGLSEAVQGVDDAMMQAELEATLATWEAVLQDSDRSADSLERIASAERDLSLTGLREIREARRALWPWVSRELREQDGSYAIEDLAQELSTLGPSLWMRARHRASTVRELPARLTDYNLLRGGAAALLWTLILGGAWLAVRTYIGEIAKTLVRRFVTVRHGLRLSDGESLRDPVERFLRALVDLLVGWLLVERLGELFPELGLLLLVYLQVALLRWVVATFDLLVVPADQARPALFALRADPFRLARRTVQGLTALLIARNFVHRLLWGWMGLDVLVTLCDQLLMAGLLAYTVLSLHRWEPHLRRRMQSRDQDSFIVAYLSKPPEVRAIQWLRALATSFFFTVAALVDLVYLVARERTGVAWVLHALNWVQTGEVSEALEPLDPAVSQQLRSVIHVNEHHRRRSAIRESLVGAWTSFRTEKRGGMLALVGDRGSGRGVAAEQLMEIASEGGVEVVSCEVPHDLGGFDEISRWLGGALGLPVCDSAAELSESLRQLPPSVIVLNKLDRAWSRRVGGFSGLGRLLDIMNGCSDRHFWVMTVHSYSWSFLSSNGSLVDLAVIRHVVHLPSMSTSELRALTASALQDAGLSADFSGLIRTSVFGGDASVEEERAVQLYFRLLSEASSGNPQVALGLWTQCLSPTSDPTVVQVTVADSLRGRILQGLSETALFTLVAVRIQEEVGEFELSEVTNIPRHMVRTTLRDLMSRGLLERRGDRLIIPDIHLPAVTRTLRRRHFLHLEA